MPIKPNSRIHVDVHQQDRGKAVTRATPDDAEPAGEVSDQERRHSEWLDKNRAVQKRIGRIQKNFDQERAEWQAERQRDRAGFEKRLKSLERAKGSTSNADDEAHEREMANLEGQYAKALDEGRSGDAAKLQRQMAEKAAAFVHAKTQAALGADDKDDTDDTDDTAVTKPGRKPSKAGLAFVAANKEWWDDPEYVDMRMLANGVHQKLVDTDGSDPESEEHYNEVARQVRAKFPKSDVTIADFKRKSKARDDDADDEDDDEDEEEQQAPVRHFRGAGSGRRGRGNRGTEITSQDEETMRAVGMDPENDAHVLEFAKAKRETADAIEGR